MTGSWVGRQMNIALTAPCVHDSNEMLTQTVGAALAAVGAPAWLTWHMEETARIATQYVAGRSDAASYRLLLNADPDGVTLSVTDHDEPGMDDSPAWLPVPHTHLHSTPASWPAAYALLLERTGDGHIRLGSHSPWTPPETTA
ncbi:hypothetical protein [Streptomyces sp. SID1034]|uniref:hypothetical protein n=1 Tax=Streptomyces sp. SID1034 TaxID=2690248 RepID=UPI00136B9E3C|nr:hypothetical protein [Streptomyces sp. SID1034]MYV93462.1 hypothetical protein [Streptomyces sp. SID1034]